MINFTSLFNQFRMGGGNSSINELLEAPDTTIARLLDEDSFVNEFKSGSNQINEFMKYDKYETLVEYVTKIGPENNTKRSYKYPMTASEILSVDSQVPIEFFFPDKQLFVTEQIQEQAKPEAETQKEDQNEDNDKKVTSVQSIQTPEQEGEQNKEVEEPKNDTEEKQKDQETLEASETKEQSKEQNEVSESPAKSEPEPEPEPPKVQKKKIQKEVEPLSNKLFSYFEGEVNYPLAGYVSKIFGAFLTKKPLRILQYLLEEERFMKLLNHVESRSVGELVVKLLTYESTQCIEERKKAFETMFEKASKSQEVFIMSNLSGAICEIIEKVATAIKGTGNQYANELSKNFFKPEIITRAISNVISDDENISIYNAPILSTYLLNVPLILPQDDQLVQNVKKLLCEFIKKALQKLNVSQESRRTLGFGRVKIVQIMSFVLKNNILESQNIAAEARNPEFFPILFNLCKNYQLNNVLHNEVLKIVETALSQDQNSSFLHSLIREQILIKFLLDETNQDMKIRAGEGSQKTRKGYINHIVLICRKLQEFAEKNTQIQKLIQKPEFDFIMENLVNKEVFEGSKNLGGYGMNKKIKNNILFMREEIIQQHSKFLTETPKPVYAVEPEHYNIDHPDLVEAEYRQHHDAGDQYIESVKNDLIDQMAHADEHVNPKFWSNHLDYNLDDLMDDLE